MLRVGVGRFDMLQKLHSFLQKLQPVPSSHPTPPRVCALSPTLDLFNSIFWEPHPRQEQARPRILRLVAPQNESVAL